MDIALIDEVDEYMPVGRVEWKEGGIVLFLADHWSDVEEVINADVRAGHLFRGADHVPRSLSMRIGQQELQTLGDVLGELSNGKLSLRRL